jgi:signal transduction histidine kinase
MDGVITGLVTHIINAPGSSIFIRTPQGPAMIACKVPASCAAGDTVSAVGHARPRAKGLIWDASAVTTLSSGTGTPAPAEMPESDAYPFARWQFELVTFSCMLADSFSVVDPSAAIPDGAWLQVNRDGRWIRVYLHNDKDSASLKDIRLGSIIRVTGICHLAAPSADGLSNDFLVNLRSHDDVSVISPGSWWTRERTLWASAILLLGLLLALAAILRLMRTVERQGSAISRALADRRILDERHRIAGELHDTLEQELVGVRLHMQAAEASLRNDPERSLASIRNAKALLERSQRESRATIIDLRSDPDPEASLADVLSAKLPTVFPDHAAAIAVTSSGTAFPIPRRIALHLERIIQESVANACKHAQARSIGVTLAYQVARVTVEVTDDGRGFDAALFDHPPAEHYGFHGMKERAQKIAARLQLTSTPGSGTRLTISWTAA